MIEAMTCGTPILAFRYGTVPEIVDESITGSIVKSAAEATRVLPGVLSLTRGADRPRIQAPFSAARTPRDYVSVYRSLRRRSVRGDRADRHSVLSPSSMHVSTNGQKTHAE